MQKSIGGHMSSNSMQPPSGHPMAGPMPPWNAMWGPQPGPPMHVPPPPGQPPQPQGAGPLGMPNGMMQTGYPPAWNSSQQTPYASTGNGWPQYQWPYGYPPQGWGAQGYQYGKKFVLMIIVLIVLMVITLMTIALMTILR